MVKPEKSNGHSQSPLTLTSAHTSTESLSLPGLKNFLVRLTFAPAPCSIELEIFNITQACAPMYKQKVHAIECYSSYTSVNIYTHAISTLSVNTYLECCNYECIPVVRSSSIIVILTEGILIMTSSIPSSSTRDT